jgi:hypothetical protein
MHRTAGGRRISGRRREEELWRRKRIPAGSGAAVGGGAMAGRDPAGGGGRAPAGAAVTSQFWGFFFYKFLHMKSCIISCILPLCTTHLFLVIVVLFLNQTFPACLITERRFYNFQSWPKFKSGGFAKIFKQKSKQIRKKKKRKDFIMEEWPPASLQPRFKKRPTAHLPPFPNRYRAPLL